MKQALAVLVALAAVALAVFATPPARAADVATVVALACDGEAVVQVQTTYAGLTKASESALKKRADQVLDLASKLQDKGGPCTATWQWGAQNAIETPGLTRQAAHQVAGRAAQFAREAADLAVKGAKGRQWGD